MQLTIVIKVWLDKISDFELPPGYTPEIPFPASSFVLKSLPLRWKRGPRESP